MALAGSHARRKQKFWASTPETSVAAINILRQQQIRVLQLKAKIHINLQFRSSLLSAGAITRVFKNLAVMLEAGIPIVEALQMLSEQEVGVAENTLVMQLATGIQEGKSLGQAMRNTGQFAALDINMIVAGEQTGAIEQALSRLAAYRERLAGVQQKLIKAMFYPLLVMFVAILVAALILVFVIPEFKTLFAQANTELPLFTLLIMGVSDLLIAYAWLWLPLLVLVFFVLRRQIRTQEQWQRGFERLLFRLPIIGTALHASALSRIAHTLSTLYAAGIAIDLALTYAAQSAGRFLYQDRVLAMAEDVASGRSLADAMRAQAIFPPMFWQMVFIGEQAGKLDAMLTQSGALYDEQLENLLSKLDILLEPLLMLVLGSIVGSLLIAMYLPLFQLSATF